MQFFLKSGANFSESCSEKKYADTFYTVKFDKIQIIRIGFQEIINSKWSPERIESRDLEIFTTFLSYFLRFSSGFFTVISKI